jgi:hypothetical protein
MGYTLFCTRMRTFQVKFILVYESTSPADLVYTLLGRAGSRHGESRRIAATGRRTNASRTHLLLFHGGGAAAAARSLRGRRSSRAQSSRAGAGGVTAAAAAGGVPEAAKPRTRISHLKV